MATWDLRRLQLHYEKRGAHNIYLVYGEDSFLIDEVLKLIKAKVLSSGAVDFNFDQFYASDASASQVRDTVEMLPVMCEKRLIFYKGVHTLKERDWDALMPILDNPVDSSVLVLVGEKVDKRKKFAKKIAENGVMLELKIPYENQIPTWVDYIAYNHQIELSRDVISLIHQMVGNSLSEINSEMFKLKQYVGERTQVTQEDVFQVVSRAKVENVFDLAAAIGRKDRAKALSCLTNILENGQSEVGALAMILRHVRILATLQEGVKKGLSGPKLSAKAGVPSFFLKDYLKQSKSWSQQKIAKTIRSLHETDRALKTSPISSHIWLENFIIQTCQ